MPKAAPKERWRSGSKILAFFDPLSPPLFFSLVVEFSSFFSPYMYSFMYHQLPSLLLASTLPSSIFAPSFSSQDGDDRHDWPSLPLSHLPLLFLKKASSSYTWLLCIHTLYQLIHSPTLRCSFFSSKRNVVGRKFIVRYCCYVLFPPLAFFHLLFATGIDFSFPISVLHIHIYTDK